MNFQNKMKGFGRKNSGKKPSQGEAAAPAGQNKENKEAGNTKAVLKKIGTVLLSAMMIGVIVMSIVGCIITVWAFDALNKDQQLVDLDMQKVKYTTIFYADDGETELARAYDPKEGNRIWADYEDMPEHLINAVIAVEDKRFRTHNGVDFFTTTKAGLNAVLQKLGFKGFFGGATPGGSTITQQVVRNITDDRASDGAAGYARKLREIFRALNLEKHATKPQIMETYLNLASFSRNCSGIQAAANVFFDKDVSELTVAECATIVGTTKNPTQYDPYTKWENNQNRKEHILGLMLEQELLTKAEYDEAMAQEIVLSHTENSNATIQSWFMDYTIEEVCEDLAEKYGYTPEEAYQQLISGGYRIYTTCDPRVQDILEDFYSNLEGFPPVSNEVYPESAFVITDTSGGIKGIVGSNRPKEGNRLWNRASDTTRQPGSTIKPISSYVLGIEKDIITYSTLIEDRQVVINPDPVTFSQPFWAPHNYYNGFKGFVTVQHALQRSINSIPVQLAQKLGTTTMYNFLKSNLGLETLTNSDDAYSPMALGSLTNGVTLVDMAGAYQMFGNGGTRTEPYSYTKVVDTYGNVILETNTVPIRVISPETADIMSRIMRTVTVQGGTGVLAGMPNGIPTAGKTGTTDDDVDQWFIGVTPYYVGVCWVGFDDRYVTDDDGNIVYRYGKPVPNTVRCGNPPPPTIWRKVMTKVHEGATGKQFPTSPDVVALQYCTETGMLAGPGCSNTAVGYYKKSNLPPTCSYHNGGYDSNIPLAGSDAASCGVTYPDQYLTDAYYLQQAFRKNARVAGDTISVREAVEMAQNGVTNWDYFLSSSYYERYAHRLKSGVVE